MRKLLNTLTAAGSILALLALAIAVIGCNPTQPSEVNVYNQNTATNNVGGPLASPSPGSGGTLPEGSNTPVFTFGQGSCPGGGVAMPNSGTLKLGCEVAVTCTPKGPDGADLTPQVHGPIADFNVSGGAIRLTVSGDNPFNATAYAQAVGFSNISCTVKNVSSRRPLELQVVP